jgi:hypothetical protein
VNDNRKTICTPSPNNQINAHPNSLTCHTLMEMSIQPIAYAAAYAATFTIVAQAASTAPVPLMAG